MQQIFPVNCVSVNMVLRKRILRKAHYILCASNYARCRQLPSSHHHKVEDDSAPKRFFPLHIFMHPSRDTIKIYERRRALKIPKNKKTRSIHSSITLKFKINHRSNASMAVATTNHGRNVSSQHAQKTRRKVKWNAVLQRCWRSWITSVAECNNQWKWKFFWRPNFYDISAMEEDRIGPIFKGRQILLTGGETHETIIASIVIKSEVCDLISRHWFHGKGFGWEAAASDGSREDLHVDASEERKESEGPLGRYVQQSGEFPHSGHDLMTVVGAFSFDLWRIFLRSFLTRSRSGWASRQWLARLRSFKATAHWSAWGFQMKTGKPSLTTWRWFTIAPQQFVSTRSWSERSSSTRAEH